MFLPGRGAPVLGDPHVGVIYTHRELAGMVNQATFRKDL
jgi:hypothetical protein